MNHEVHIIAFVHWKSAKYCQIQKNESV